MKKLITLLYLVPFLAVGQSWCPPGATWKFDTGDPWTISNTLIEYSGDTVVDGYLSQRFQQATRITRIIGFDTLINTQGPDFYTRTNGDVVWEYNGTEWDTLYWFSAVPGDKWTPFSSGGNDCSTSYWLVMDTSTTIVEGIPLRTLSLIGTDGDLVFNLGETIMERLGGNIGGANFPGYLFCSMISECYCTRICYRDQDINSNSNCQITLNVDDALGSLSELNVIPQPANEMVAVTSTKGDPIKQVLVFELRGEIIFNVTTNGTERYVLDVTQLPVGYYVLRTLDVSGAVRMAPLIIAR